MTGPNYNRKGAIVERLVNEKTRKRGVVRLDKGSMTFFARYPDDAPGIERPDQFESKIGSEVTAWLKKRLAKTEGSELLEWIPIAMVKLSKDNNYGRNAGALHGGFSLDCSRFYVALLRDKTYWLQLEWAQCDSSHAAALAPEDRVSSARNFLPGPASATERGGLRSQWGDPIVRSFPFARREEHYLPHTPELWAALRQVVNTIGSAEEHIRKLLTTKDGLKELLEGGAKLLPRST